MSTNREVLDQLSNAKLARLLVKFGIECRACPAREACARHWIPCEQQIERWLEQEYEGDRTNEKTQ